MSASIQILLLAAGRSSRMRGTDKLLELVDGQPLLRRLAERCAAVAETIVVIGDGQQDRLAVICDLPVRVVPVAPGRPMSQSLIAGLSRVKADGCLVVLSDMPDVSRSDISHFFNAFSRNPNAIHRATDMDGTPGNPVLFPRRLFPDLQQLTGDMGARNLLKAEKDQVIHVKLPGNHATTNLNTPEDWAKWRQTQKGRRV